MTTPDWFTPIREGRREALDALFLAQWDALCAYATAIVRSPAAAEDVVQEVFVELWQRRAHLTPAVDAIPYLFTATRNRALNHLREQGRRERRHLHVERPEVEEPLAESQLAAEELKRAIQQCINGLPPRSREVFTLSRFAGLTYNEIAATLGISPKTVEVHMGRALARLHRCLAPALRD